MDIHENQREVFRQKRRGRPSANTSYRREVRSCVELSWSTKGRRARRPTARRVIDALEPLRRHEIHQRDAGDEEPRQLLDSLDDTQQRLLRLLGIQPKTYGR